jgi:archaemetzincin
VTVVEIVPLGSPPENVLLRVEDGLARVLGFATHRAAGREEPADAFDPARGQWSSAEILKDLVRQFPAGNGRVLGVTERDLFVPVLSFVYGQAQLRGRAAVISLARLRPEFFGLPRDPEVVAGRALKEAVHELGHTLGLVHCLDRRCPMSLSIGLADLDHKTAEPCPSCSALLEGSLDMQRMREQGDEPLGGGR